uniref:Calmodulin-lysine N-methyltransferase n=1 Tax=Rhizochromulina marina TaxID=1034831 RepID=A0A7S2WGL8_9STRA|mmetsp:Transcript_24087/g.70634  ORF Transcript_24087/g.70634 Transcript_24087/m.70634 type:complete len:282 (+) Transcript_24087:3-848(+)
MQEDVVVTSEFDSDYLECPVKLVQQQAKGIGFQLWPAATFLCRYLEESITGSEHGQLFGLDKPLEQLHCLELGAGIGLAGLFAAGLGCRTATLTDLPEVLPILEKNLDANPSLADRVFVAPLSWGTDDWRLAHQGRVPDLILAADCVYWPELFAPLEDTLFHLCSQFGATVLLAHTKRWKRDEKFFSLCRKRLSVQKIHEVVERSGDCGEPLTVASGGVGGGGDGGGGPFAPHGTTAASSASNEPLSAEDTGKRRVVRRIYQIRRKEVPSPPPEGGSGRVL